MFSLNMPMSMYSCYVIEYTLDCLCNVRTFYTRMCFKLHNSTTFCKSTIYNKSIVDARHLLEICRGKLFIAREKNYMEIKRLS